MKYLKKFENIDEIGDMIGKLSHLTTIMRQEVGRQKRREVVDDKTFRNISQDYREYFYDFIDDDWKVYLNETQFYVNIEISKTFTGNFNSEDIFNKINPLLQSIKKEFTDNGFNTHYQILFNRIPQCENNPETHKNDIYVYKGDWDDEISKGFNRDELKVYIRFYFI